MALHFDGANSPNTQYVSIPLLTAAGNFTATLEDVTIFGPLVEGRLFGEIDSFESYCSVTATEVILRTDNSSTTRTYLHLGAIVSDVPFKLEIFRVSGIATVFIDGVEIGTGGPLSQDFSITTIGAINVTRDPSVSQECQIGSFDWQGANSRAYLMNEGTGTNVADSSGGGNDGTLVNDDGTMWNGGVLGPLIIDINGGSIYPGQTPSTITGTLLGANSGTLALGTLAIDQPVISNNDTSGTFTAVQSGLPYGSHDAVWTDTLAAPSAAFPVNLIANPATKQYIDAVNPITGLVGGFITSVFYGTTAITGDQWESDLLTSAGNAITQQADGEFTIAGPVESESFNVRLWDSTDNTWSVEVIQTVNGAIVQPPAITSNPSNSIVAEGSGQASFTATASGDPTPTVQWEKDTQGNNIFADVIGETSNTIIVLGSSVTIAANDGDQYRAVFTNTGGTATSNSAILSVVAELPDSGSVYKEVYENVLSTVYSEVIS